MLTDEKPSLGYAKLYKTGISDYLFELQHLTLRLTSQTLSYLVLIRYTLNIVLSSSISFSEIGHPDRGPPLLLKTLVTVAITFTCPLLSLQVFQGNRDRDSVHINTLDPPIYARYIRVQPVTYHGWMSLRMELYGCRSGRDM